MFITCISQQTAILLETVRKRKPVAQVVCSRSFVLDLIPALFYNDCILLSSQIILCLCPDWFELMMLEWCIQEVQKIPSLLTLITFACFQINDSTDGESQQLVPRPPSANKSRLPLTPPRHTALTKARMVLSLI